MAHSHLLYAHAPQGNSLGGVNVGTGGGMGGGDAGGPLAPLTPPRGAGTMCYFSTRGTGTSVADCMRRLYPGG